MSKPSFTISCVATDRTRSIATGEVQAPECTLSFDFGEPEVIFREALRSQAFQICELSMSSHMITTARGDTAYIGVPVFLSRAFRHSAIFVRSDGGLSSLSDLAGKSIGLPEYQQTAAMWVRGMMREAGVAASDVTWHVGGVNAPSAGERIALSLPENIRLHTLSGDQTLDDMLLAGDIDAIISPRVPASVERGDPRVRRLFPDLRAAEEAFYKETHFFPIMHCLAVRRDVADANPWLPAVLFRVFSEAKQARLAELAMTNVLRTCLPWSVHDYRDAMALTDNDPWPYGFRRNLAELEAMTASSHADGTSVRKVDPAELFHPSTLELSEVTL